MNINYFEYGNTRLEGLTVLKRYCFVLATGSGADYGIDIKEIRGKTKENGNCRDPLIKQ